MKIEELNLSSVTSEELFAVDFLAATARNKIHNLLYVVVRNGLCSLWMKLFVRPVPKVPLKGLIKNKRLVKDQSFIFLCANHLLHKICNII